MTNKAIGMFNLVAETFVTLHIDFFIAFVDGAQCIYDISGNNLCIIGRTPNVWFYTQKMLMLIVLDGIVGVRFIGIVMMVGVDADKAITGISVVSHAETSGIGTKVVGNEPNAAGEPVLDQFIGESGAGSLVVGKNIIAVSGATVSTKGINMGANAALAVAELLG